MGLFSNRPKCPVTEDDKAWIEMHYVWLADQFGIDMLLEPVVTISEAHFPAYFIDRDLRIRTFLDTVCTRMGVDPEQVEVEYYEHDPNAQLDSHLHLEGDGKSALGLYWGRYRSSRVLIHLNRTLFRDKESLIATMAHELSHARLLGEFRINPEREDHEHLTDLTAVFFGYGILLGNSAFRREAWTDGEGWSGWRMQTQGYLPVEMIGYALALHLHLAGAEARPLEQVCDKALRNVLRKGVRYLERFPAGDPDLVSIREAAARKKRGSYVPPQTQSSTKEEPGRSR